MTKDQLLTTEKLLLEHENRLTSYIQKIEEQIKSLKIVQLEAFEARAELRRQKLEIQGELHRL